MKLYIIIVILSTLTACTNMNVANPKQGKWGITERDGG